MCVFETNKCFQKIVATFGLKMLAVMYQHLKPSPFSKLATFSMKHKHETMPRKCALKEYVDKDCQMTYFLTKNPNLIYFCRPWNGKFGHIIWPFWYL
jgi:hypothetical protein